MQKRGPRTRKMKLSRQQMALLGAAAATLVVAWLLWPRPAPEQAPARVVAVESMLVRRGNLSDTLTVVGQVQANQGVQLRSEITGRVARLPLQEGSRVVRGTLLVQLDDSVQRAELARAEATLQLSENNLGRTQRLLADNAASQQALDNAVADAKLARANVQLAKANLAKAYIMAPLDGVVGIRQVNVGDYIQPGSVLVAVTENDKLRVTFRLPEQVAAGMRVGTPVTIIADSTNVQVTAPITTLDTQVDPASRTRQAQVVLDVGEEGLVAGQFVRVTVPTATVANALIVPTQALVPSGQTTNLFVVTTSGTQTVASRTTVTVGLRVKDFVQITAGVTQGQRVVTAGQQKLQAPVMPVTLVTPTVITVRPAPVEELPMNAESNPGTTALDAPDSTPGALPSGSVGAPPATTGSGTNSDYSGTDLPETPSDQGENQELEAPASGRTEGGAGSGLMGNPGGASEGTGGGR